MTPRTAGFGLGEYGENGDNGTDGTDGTYVFFVVEADSGCVWGRGVRYTTYEEIQLRLVTLHVMLGGKNPYLLSSTSISFLFFSTASSSLAGVFYLLLTVFVLYLMM